MRIRRVIIPLIVALGAAGSIMVGSAAPTVAAQAPAAHALSSPHFVPMMHYYD